MSWIKIEQNLPDKPEIGLLAELLDLDYDAVTGKLIRFWVWADQNLADCNAISVTHAQIDRLTFAPGFAKAMISVGWLIEDEAGITLPNFDRHNGETAKKRALTARRVGKSRSTPTKCNASSVTDVTQVDDKCNASSVTNVLPEKIREDKRREDIITKPIVRVLTPIQQDLHSHFKRRQSTAWSDKERKAYRSATAGKTAEEFAEEVSLVLADQSKSEYPVKSLETLLNNWSRKIDEASMVPAKAQTKRPKIG